MKQLELITVGGVSDHRDWEKFHNGMYAPEIWLMPPYEDIRKGKSFEIVLRLMVREALEQFWIIIGVGYIPKAVKEEIEEYEVKEIGGRVYREDRVVKTRYQPSYPIVESQFQFKGGPCNANQVIQRKITLECPRLYNAVGDSIFEDGPFVCVDVRWTRPSYQHASIRYSFRWIKLVEDPETGEYIECKSPPPSPHDGIIASAVAIFVILLMLWLFLYGVYKVRSWYCDNIGSMTCPEEINPPFPFGEAELGDWQVVL